MQEKHKHFGNVALIVAGGVGLRAGGDVPKQYSLCDGESVLSCAIKAFLEHSEIHAIQVVINKSHIDLYQDVIGKILSVDKEILPVVYGGDDRQKSVKCGLDILQKHRPNTVLVHDAARPFVTANVIDRVLQAVDRGSAAVIPVIPVVDTIKQVCGDVVKNTPDRDHLRAVQTPQGFHFRTLYDLHHRADSMFFTDDAGMCEDFGIEVITVEGDPVNRKLTTQDDMAYLMHNRTQGKKNRMLDVRTGSGFDVHRFDEGAENSVVILCGVEIPHTHSLVGHSDADVALHALVDALLGAVAKGDIGQHFPPDDEQWRGANSPIFVEYANKLVHDSGYIVSNVDITLLCEKPKIGPYRDMMQQKISEIMKLDISRVSVKATTTEKLGFTGRKEGIAAQAVVTIIK